MSSRLPPLIDGLTFIRSIGTGGYADVHEYRQDNPELRVAVKVLHADDITELAKQRFTAEANTMARLADHPYIVQVFRAGVTGDGRPYLVMKYYPPPNLAERVRVRPLSVAGLLRLGIQISGAVETAHRAGILHRDIKPANILVDAYNSPGLADFGIAGLVDDDSHDDVGVSVPWSAPEILEGRSNGSVRSDVYSLAATLWDLLAGRSPYEVPGADNGPRALMARIFTREPTPIGRADVPPSLERLLRHAMARDPAQRPSTARDVARALQAIEHEEGFSRTELVIPEDRTAAAEPRPGKSSAPATIVRAPQRVEGQTLTPRPALQSDSAQDRTRLRPAATTPEPDLEPKKASAGEPMLPPRRRGLRPAAVAGIGAALMAVAIAGVVVMTTRGGQPRPTSTPTITQSVVPPPEIPEVTVSREGKQAVFSWTSADQMPGDVFIYQLWSSGVPGVDQTTKVAQVRHTLPAKGDFLCLVVKVRRPGAAETPFSDKRCIT